jgi:alcohol dehydrogenase
MGALAPQAGLVLLGAGKDALPLSAGRLVVGERNVLGSITGTLFESERRLDFSVLAGVRPRIETMPLDRAAEGVARMKSGLAKFRMG